MWGRLQPAWQTEVCPTKNTLQSCLVSTICSGSLAITGAGLGLAIVEKALQRMGGQFELDNAPEGGLVAHIRVKRAP